MKVSRYIREEFVLIFLSILLFVVENSFNPRVLLYDVLTIFIIFSLLELMHQQQLRYYLYALLLFLISFSFLHPIHLVLLTYFLTRSFKYWALLALPLLWMLQVENIFYYIFVFMAYYLALTSSKMAARTERYYFMQDALNVEKITAKKQQDEIAQAQRNNLEIAILEERNRISQQLHDAVGHSLARSIMQIEAMKTLPQAEQLLDPLGQLQQNLQHGMNDIRETIHVIHRESLQLKTSVEELQKDLPKFSISYHENIQASFVYSYKVDLLTIIREVVHNSVKHSNATEIQIILHEYPGVIKLMLKDNGTDFNSDSPIQDGIGQTMIRQLGQKYHASTIINYHNGYLTQLIFDKKKLTQFITQKED